MPFLTPRPKHILHRTNALDPAHLIGKHVIGFMDDYPLELTLKESPSEPLEIHFGGKYGGGRNFEYQIEDHLNLALEKAARLGTAATGAPGVKIIDAHTAEVTKRYEVPVNDALPQHIGKLWHDHITIIGIRLEGMDKIGYIWGEDTDGGWEEFCKYCGTFILSEEQKREMNRMEEEDRGISD